jgi:hypothetical protein
MWLYAPQVATNNEVMRIADCYQDPRWQGHEMDQKTSAALLLLRPSCNVMRATAIACACLASRACACHGMLADFKTRNMLVYPICAPGDAEKPVGVLQMINKIGGAFDSADEELLAAFSNKAAPLISAHPMYYKHEEAQNTEAEALSGSLPSPKVRHRCRAAGCCCIAVVQYGQGGANASAARPFACCHACGRSWTNVFLCPCL